MPCACGEIFHRRDVLTRHQTTCSRSTVTVNAIGTQNIQNNNLNFNIQLFGSTASALTPDVIRDKVIEALSCEEVEKGIARMTEAVAPHLFQNEKHNWTIRVADASRKKLLVRTDQGDVPDVGARRTAGLLREPFIRAGFMALEESNRKQDVKSTMVSIGDDESYDKEASRALLAVAPSEFENNPLMTDAHRAVLVKAKKQLNRALMKWNREQKERTALETAKWKEDFLDHSQDLHDGTFWHPIHRFVIQPDTDREFSILGKREKRTDQTIQLTRADLGAVSKMGLGRYLAPEYAARLEEPAA